MTDAPRTIGRFEVHAPIARGGMATIHLAQLRTADWRPIVAIKTMRDEVASDPDFVAMFLDEARVAMRIQHPNVVQTFEVLREGDALALVMEYVHGESLGTLLRCVSERGERVPLRIVGAIFADALAGLHAAHETRDEHGEPLGVVHRDVSPQNVLVGADGFTRVIDFGIAKAARKLHQTKEGAVKGKFAYMAPERIEREDVSRAADVYSATVVLWETLTGVRFAAGKTATQVVEQVLYGRVPSPSELVPDLPPCVDDLCARGLARVPMERFATAEVMASAVRQCLGVASPREVAAWVRSLAEGALSMREQLIAKLSRPPS